MHPVQRPLPIVPRPYSISPEPLIPALRNLFPAPETEFLQKLLDILLHPAPDCLHRLPVGTSELWHNSFNDSKPLEILRGNVHHLARFLRPLRIFPQDRREPFRRENGVGRIFHHPDLVADSRRQRAAADFNGKFIKVEAMADKDNYATLDSKGAIWAIGAGIGKPGVGPSWNTDDGVWCMAQTENGVYRITFTAGASISKTGFSFKFFCQRGWGGEFGSI